MMQLEEITDLCDAYRDGSLSEAEARRLIRLWYDPRTRELVDRELALQGALCALCGSVPELRPRPDSAPSRARLQTPSRRSALPRPPALRGLRPWPAAVLLGCGILIGALGAWLLGPADPPPPAERIAVGDAAEAPLALDASGRRPIPLLGGRLLVGPDTLLQPPAGSAAWRIERGHLRGVFEPGSRHADPLEIVSPQLDLRITGTVFDLNVGETGELQVLSGTVEASDRQGRSLRLGPGERCVADREGFVATPADLRVLLEITPGWTRQDGGGLSEGAVAEASAPLSGLCFRGTPRFAAGGVTLWTIEWHGGSELPLLAELPPEAMIEAVVRIQGQTDYAGWYLQHLGSGAAGQYSGGKRHSGTDGWELWRLPLASLVSKTGEPYRSGELELIQLHCRPGPGVVLECARLRVVVPAQPADGF